MRRRTGTVAWTAALLMLAALPGAFPAEKPPDKLDLESILADKDKAEILKTEMEEAGAGDNKEFTINTDDNIATLALGDVYRSDEKTFFKISSIKSQGISGGAFVVQRTSGKGEPGQRLVRVSGAGPLTIAARLTLLDLYVMGGPFLHPIALLGFFAIILAVNSILIYRKNRQCPPQFVEAASRALEKGDVKKFEELALQAKGLLPHVARALADRYDTSTVEELKERCSIAASKQIQRLRITVKALNLIAVAAPLLGLLGTIVGMVIVFDAVASATGAAKAAALAAGIRVKLFSTASALIVAIPSLFLYFIFNQRLTSIIGDCETIAEQFLHRIAVLKRSGKSPKPDADEEQKNDAEEKPPPQRTKARKAAVDEDAEAGEKEEEAEERPAKARKTVTKEESEEKDEDAEKDGSEDEPSAKAKHPAKEARP
ncbi:MAG: MotA/TolQ/ExbB proton channel family protein [Planctomycetota bacterium]|nr:MotA/TolQ/ExbB proton channel family protein [Planctomycetota bacterium]